MTKNIESEREAIDGTLDATPRIEALHPFANRPYTMLGVHYVPKTTLVPFLETGIASWYGRQFHGQKTAIGETYDMFAMTAAHPTAPLPSYLRVTNLENNRSVTVRVNDRGPFVPGRIVDVSYAAAAKLGFVNSGSASVEVELLSATNPSPHFPQAKIDRKELFRDRVAEPTQERADGWYLQLAAFTVVRNAQHYLNQVQASVSELTGREVRVVGHEQFFRVHVGPFATRTIAEEVEKKLKQSLGIQRVVLISP